MIHRGQSRLHLGVLSQERESTLVASLLWPQAWRYEVMPWPERIFRGAYATPAADQPRDPASNRRGREPAAYATELMTVATALNDMNHNDVSWDCGTRGIGVVVSDTMMFQRGDPCPSDPDLGSSTAWPCPSSSTASRPNLSNSRTSRPPGHWIVTGLS